MATAHSRVAPAPEGPPARLREARLAAGMTQGELADRVGFAAPAGQLAISRYERGTVEIPLVLGAELASALGVSLDWLATGRGRQRVSRAASKREPGAR